MSDMDLFYSDFTLGRNGDNNDDLYLNLNDVLYSDVDLTSFNCLTPDEVTSPALNGMMAIKSPWSDSDSGVSEVVSEINIASPEIDAVSVSEEHETELKSFVGVEKKDQSDQCWIIENDVGLVTGNGSLDLNSLGHNYHAKQQQQVANYLKLVNTDNADMVKSTQSTMNVGLLTLGLCQNDNSIAKTVNKTISVSSVSNRFTSDSSSSNSASEFDSDRTGTEKSFEKENKLYNSTYKNKHTNLSSSNNDVDGTRNKNAIQAKLNREKKKAYVKGLELEVEALKKENKELKSDNCHFKHVNNDLLEEVEYLKAVLVNSSALSSLLQNIGNSNGVKLSASIMNRKRKLDNQSCEDTSCGPSPLKKKMNAGICLHVTESQASIELCARCASMAQKTYDSDVL